MTRDEAVQAAKQAGFSQVETYGGPVALDDWTPYGKREGHTINFRLYEDGTIHETVPAIFGDHDNLATGIWHLS